MPKKYSEYPISELTRWYEVSLTKNFHASYKCLAVSGEDAVLYKLPVITRPQSGDVIWVRVCSTGEILSYYVTYDHKDAWTVALQD